MGIQNQINLKSNALEKFISDEISKIEYDDFIKVIQTRIEQLELEKSKIRTSNEISIFDGKSVLKNQLDEFLQLGELTREVLYSFVEKVEVTESRDVRLNMNLQNLKKFR